MIKFDGGSTVPQMSIEGCLLDGVLHCRESRFSIPLSVRFESPNVDGQTIRKVEYGSR